MVDVTDPKKYFQLTNYRVVDSNTLSVQVSVNAANISSVDNAVGSNAVNGLYNFIVQVLILIISNQCVLVADVTCNVQSDCNMLLCAVNRDQ